MEPSVGSRSGKDLRRWMERAISTTYDRSCALAGLTVFRRETHDKHVPRVAALCSFLAFLVQSGTVTSRGESTRLLQK
jgi:hypothetical protein